MKSSAAFGAAQLLRESIGAPLLSHAQEEYDWKTGQARLALGEGVFAVAWNEGRALTWEQAAEEG